jgi:hypothetical protein
VILSRPRLFSTRHIACVMWVQCLSKNCVHCPATLVAACPSSSRSSSHEAFDYDVDTAQAFARDVFCMNTHINNISC